MKHKKQHHLYLWFFTALGLAVFTALFLIVFIVSNWGAFKNEVAFALKPKQQKSPAVVVVSPSPNPIASPTPTPEPIIEPAHIVIDKIGVDTPISWDVAAEETLDYLDKGVAHLKGSARPWETGNTFITGHSSDFVWKRNPYAAVFSLVPKLVKDDTIRIHENGKTYTYKVVETKIVNPDQVEVANQTATPVLTLMTCWPVGTTQQRFIVHAALVSAPDPTQPGKQVKSTHLPEIKFR